MILAAQILFGLGLATFLSAVMFFMHRPDMQLACVAVGALFLFAAAMAYVLSAVEKK